MKKLYWWTLGIIGSLAGIACLVFVWLIFQDINQAGETAEKSSNTEELKESVKAEGPMSEESYFVNPFGETTTVEGLSSLDYTEYIHGMSHQKVEAEEKWVFYEMTEERITWLLNALDEVEVNHEEKYREILERWNKGDFSMVDKDHNIVWRLKHGTVGKATGILSAEEEQAYLEIRRK